MVTDAEKIAVYESLLHRIQLHREITMDSKRVVELLDAIGNWSYAHRAGNGLPTEAGVESAFNRLRASLRDKP